MEKNGKHLIWFCIFLIVILFLLVLLSSKLHNYYNDSERLATKQGIIIDLEINSNTELYIYFNDGDYILIEESVRSVYALILPYKNKEVIFEYNLYHDFFENQFVSIKEVIK